MNSLYIKNFQNYLRIKTVQPLPNYEEAKEFLLKIGKDYGLITSTYEIVKSKPIIVMTMVGSQPELPTILLNSHIDVVPVFQEHWIHDPFEAVIDDGKIYARGAQDMKSVGMQYLEAVGLLVQSNIKLKRTVHLLYVPDEEIGGKDGMEIFVNTDYFKNLNVGYVLDEGLPSETDVFKVYYAERSAWWLEIICSGNPGHGSMFIQDNAAEKFRKIINHFLEFRDCQEKKIKDDNLQTADVISVNLTMVKGGIQQNVVPAELRAFFDIRVPPTVDLVAFEETLNKFKEESGAGITYNFIQKPTKQCMTSTKISDPFWTAFSNSFDTLNIKKSVEIFPGATDSRFIREAGFSAIGFSPINNTKQLLHDHNEYVPVNVYLNGIDIYKLLITNLANV